jgi:prolipoprotein diacylglyceryltransferase
LGGVAAVSWVLKKNKIPWLIGADMAVPALALAYGVGRSVATSPATGDWGAVTTVPWGVAYTRAIVGWADPTTGIPYAPACGVHPTPIYEFLQGVFVFAVLWSLRKKGFSAGHAHLALLSFLPDRCASSSNSGASTQPSDWAFPRPSGSACCLLYLE